MKYRRATTTLGLVALSSLLGCSGEGETPPKQEPSFVVEYIEQPMIVKTVTPVEDTFEMTPLELAIWSVESDQRTGAILGDNGNARGPLQIWRACWIDATQFDPSIGGTYEDCADLEYAVRIFRAYTARYATERRLGRTPTDIDKARIWNGGPNGDKKSATLGYAEKVRARS